MAPQQDTVAEWLRRSTRNRLGVSRVGSSPASVGNFLLGRSLLMDCGQHLLLHPFAYLINAIGFSMLMTLCATKYQGGYCRVKSFLYLLLFDDTN